jgi:hypothetical protein
MKRTTTRLPRSVSPDEALELLEEHSTTDLSLAAFARSKGVAAWSLYNARAAARKRKGLRRSADFVECRLDTTREPTPAPRTEVEIALPSGLSLRVGRGFDEIALRRLLGVLGSC